MKQLVEVRYSWGSQLPSGSGKLLLQDVRICNGLAADLLQGQLGQKSQHSVGRGKNDYLQILPEVLAGNNFLI